jgi:hypothetical protein
MPETPTFPVPQDDDEIPLALLVARPVETIEEAHESPFKKQGREKRPRLGSPPPEDKTEDRTAEFVESETDVVAVKEEDPSSPIEAGESMASFRFPPGPVRKSHSDQPPQISIGALELSESASRSLDDVKRELEADHDSGSDMDEVSSGEDKENTREPPVIRSPTPPGNVTQDTERSPVKPSQDTLAGDDEEYIQELIIPPSLPGAILSATFPTSATTKAFPGPITLSPLPGSAGGKRRAPIPLDFKHSSGNTVPAAKFKALVQNVIQQNRDKDNGKP